MPRSKQEESMFDQQSLTDLRAHLIRQKGLENLPDLDFRLFVQACERTGLDPFTRQIYLIGRKSKVDGEYVSRYQAECSIDGFRLIATRTGEYEGELGPLYADAEGTWRDLWISTGYPFAARVGVNRKGFRETLWSVAHWSEYVQTSFGGNVASMWAKMPSTMIGKCAEALALRRAFPNELSGLYTSDEMAQATPPEADAATDQVNTQKYHPAEPPKPVVRPPLPPKLTDPIVKAAPPPEPTSLYLRVVRIRDEAVANGATGLPEIPPGWPDTTYSDWIVRRSAQNPLVAAAAERITE